MNYIAASFFDQESWNKAGLNWIRNCKSQSLDALIIGDGLSTEALAKIEELKYVHKPLIKKFKNNSNIFYTLVQSMNKDQRCLWTRPELMPKNGLISNSDLLCGYSNLSAIDLADHVINLYDRAAMIESLEQQIFKNYGKYLSADYMLGTYDFWNGFFGCKAYLHGNRYIQNERDTNDLVLNFFMAFTNSMSLEIKEYDD